MNAKLVLLGKLADMSRRARRRTMVIIFYAVMLLLITVGWLLTHFKGSSIYFGLLSASQETCSLAGNGAVA